MSRLNIGPVIRAKKWRRLYARVWFVLISLSVFAVLYLTEHRVNEILFILPFSVDLWMGSSTDPRFLAFLSALMVYATATVFLLCKTNLRVRPAFFLALATLYLALLVRLFFLASYVHFHGSWYAERVDLMTKAFALPGLVASLFAFWNETRYRAAAKSILSASDLSRIQTFKRTKRPKVDLPPESRKSSAYESLRTVTIAFGVFITLVL
jgi:hypothetical protein